MYDLSSVRRQYFLAGFGRCACCGGSMQVVSRASSAGRRYRYVCTTYWNRGATICANGAMLDMAGADQAVRTLLAGEVLRPAIVEAALDRALELLNDTGQSEARQTTIVRRLAPLEVELSNLSDTAARGGAVPAILLALERRDEERRRLAGELAGLQSQARRPTDAKAVRARLRGFLRDWDGLLAGNVAEARPLLNVALADRIVFRPVDDGKHYELTVPIAFDRVMTAAVPELAGLQDRVASPTGFEPVFWP